MIRSVGRWRRIEERAGAQRVRHLDRDSRVLLIRVLRSSPRPTIQRAHAYFTEGHITILQPIHRRSCSGDVIGGPIDAPCHPPHGQRATIRRDQTVAVRSIRPGGQTEGSESAGHLVTRPSAPSHRLDECRDIPPCRPRCQPSWLRPGLHRCQLRTLRTGSR